MECSRKGLQKGQKMITLLTIAVIILSLKVSFGLIKLFGKIAIGAIGLLALLIFGIPALIGFAAISLVVPALIFIGIGTVVYLIVSACRKTC